MSRFLDWILLLVLFTPNVGAAQTPRPFAEGERVRVAYRCKVVDHQVTECRGSRRPRLDTGVLQALDRDTLRIRAKSSGAELAIPTAAVDQLWVVNGTKGNFLAGAGIGLLAGALIGAAIGSTLEVCFFGCSPATEFGVIIGAPVGFLIGGGVGATIQSDRWWPVPINDHRVSVRPRLDTIGLNVSLAF